MNNGIDIPSNILILSVKFSSRFIDYLAKGEFLRSTRLVVSLKLARFLANNENEPQKMASQDEGLRVSRF